MSATAKPTPCRCKIYKFPHRRSDRCDDAEAEAIDVPRYSVTRLNADDALELALFDAAEARAVNSGAW